MKNVLVAYASKRGSTAEIAEAIAEELRECGLVVDCVPADQVATVEPYDAVVLGSAVYIKHWRGDARRFLRHNAGGLSRRPFWVFSSGPVGEGSDEIEQGWVEPPRIVERVEALGVREHVVFGGRVPTPPKNRLERSLVERTTPQYRDCRDWREIRAWAAAIGSALGARRRESVVR